MGDLSRPDPFRAIFRIKGRSRAGQYAIPGGVAGARSPICGMKSASSPPGDSWMERFERTWFAHHPVDATFVGLHEHDHRLSDLSAEGIAETVGALRDLLASLAADGVDGGSPGRATDAVGPGPADRLAADPAGPQPAERLAGLDRRLAAGALRIRLWEYESRHMLRNPSVHAGEAVFSMMSLLLADGASTPHVPSPERAEALAARMGALPAYLDQARAHVAGAPLAWTERALRECRGGLAFLDAGLAHVDADLGAAPDSAADALRGFAAFLEAEVRPNPGSDDDVACGSEAFELLLRDGHFIEESPDEIVAYARDEIVRTRAWLSEMAADFGAGTPEGVLATLNDHHPEADDYYARYRAVWDAMREAARERRLLTWPEAPIRYGPRPAWSRAAAPDLYFLFYRSPAAYETPAIHDYMVAPLPEGADADTITAFLRANNDSVIKLNHVVHHGGIGHHVQNWHARRSPLRIGRVAAVDCASRIAMFCGGTMAEGWACYATDLMAEAGALTPAEQYAEHAGRLRMCARAVVDVELHHGRMTLDEAARCYVETAGMSEAAAKAEAVKNSMFPGAALMYLMGTDTIHQLRRDLMQALGDRFDLGAFHDAFLSYGSIPVRLVAGEMRRRTAAGEPLGAHESPETVR